MATTEVSRLLVATAVQAVAIQGTQRITHRFQSQTVAADAIRDVANATPAVVNVRPVLVSTLPDLERSTAVRVAIVLD